MNDLFETIKLHLPPYLSPQRKEQLFNEIKNFPQNFNYYTQGFESEILQGDGWTGLTVIDIDTLSKKLTKAIILSNSCDLSPENKRILSPKIIFAPLIRLDQYIALLQKAGIKESEINEKMNVIRQQCVASIFYLPARDHNDHEHIAILNDVHSQPIHTNDSNKMKKLFTLSQSAFYLFLLKLSIHFCRFNDNLNRYSPTEDDTSL